jgi:hypothetical protein
MGIWGSGYSASFLKRNPAILLLLNKKNKDIASLLSVAKTKQETKLLMLKEAV